MAKGLKKIKLSIKTPKTVSLDTEQPSSPSSDDDWQTRNDADKIRDYSRLTQDKTRHRNAIEHLQNERRAMSGILGGETGGDADDSNDANAITPRTIARSGRKASVRVPRSAGRR